MTKRYDNFPRIHCRKWKIKACVLLFCTLLTVSCGKNDSFQKHTASQSPPTTEAFAESFFTENNFPYQKLQSNDILLGKEEYLFYIQGGAVYRTTQDYAVVIVARSELHEEENRRGTDYSGELYPLFEDDAIDQLKYCAAGQYALMTDPSTIPDWNENELVEAFMAYAAAHS